jgi:hypothetical protein
MTDLEERVRDALRAWAGDFTASPDAWERTRARAGRRAIRRQARRPERQRWLTRFTPLAAAAAVVVIGVGTATLAETGGFSAALRQVGLGHSGNSAPQATSSGVGPLGFAGSPCAFPGQSKKIPVTGVPISAKVTLDGVTTWWARVPERAWGEIDSSGHERVRKTDLALCQVHGEGGSGTPEWPLGEGQLVQASGPVNGLGAGSSMSGIAAVSVTSVEADLANGNVVRGYVAYGRGFPDAVWWLTYPQGIAASVVFRDAAGRAVKEMPEPYPPTSSTGLKVKPTKWDPTRSCEQVRVQQVANGTKVWTYVGFTVPEPVQPNHAPPTLCESTGIAGAEASFVGTYRMPAGQAARTFFVLYPTSSVSGIAVRGVTSVTAVLPGGAKYTGTLLHDKLFTYPVWIVSYPLKDPATLVFRDAAGKEVAVLHEPANP